LGMTKRFLGIALAAIAIGVGLYLILNGWPVGVPVEFSHAAFAAGTPTHGSAPTLHCWDCHGSHPDRSQVPPADTMFCFDCHTVQ